ncbi:MAG: universal stress protein [Elainella sp.]
MSHQPSHQPQGSFRRIVVALDGSPNSDLVLENAIGLARLFQSQLLLIHAISAAESTYLSPSFAVRGVYPVFSPEEFNFQFQQWQAAQDASLKLLQAYQAKVVAAGLTAELIQGKTAAGPAICAAAKDWNADLIVLGRRGYSGLGELLMGSVSNYVLHHACCSVLTVQGPELQETSDINTGSSNETATNEPSASEAVEPLQS